ncbi:hypothetical protein RP726_05785 [Candidatus Methylospira mobilis]|uniref:hypothetical protein n=1 Tax=Candidatus Methylospira mobilis TaxID=1808979 RepID=UPI0028ECA63B|nr:hypothetical protein [Candidatus Methylospira mobilis]WNV05923.1 hypothetical protein RP726_05785 [Candidatus Methylospira mobilis]
MNGELVLQSLIPTLQPWWPTIIVIGEITGFFMIVSGLIKSASKHDRSTANVLWSIVPGLILVNFLSFMDTLAQSFFSSASATGLGYTPPGNDPTSLYIQFAVYVVMLVGAAGVVQGAILLKRAGEDGRLVGTALTHLVGGVFGVNIVMFATTLANSMGPTVAGAVARLMGTH